MTQARMTQFAESKQNMSPSSRLLWGALGGYLAFQALRRPNLLNLALGAGGAAMLYNSVRGVSPLNDQLNIYRTQKNGIHVKRAMTIGKPPADLYAFWRRYENLPRFMSHLESVTEGEGGRSHWVAKAPAGTSVAWDAETTEDVPGGRISWRSLEGATIPNEGHVTFKEAPGGRGTEVHVELVYRPPLGTLGASFARLFGEEPGQQIEDDLRRLKRLLEVGFEPTIQGQSSGRDTALGKATAALYDNERTGSA